MKKDFNPILIVTVLLTALVLLVSACAPTETAVVNTQTSPETYTDPFTYCAVVGTIDQPDARYTGSKVSDVIVQGFIKASGSSPDAASSDAFKEMTIWRCMDKKVYVCNFGANLPCDSKADTDKTPTQEMNDFCKENNDADFIPMAVTGHSTIYSWHCVKGAAELLDQIAEPDAAGFLKHIWYVIEPEK